MKKKIKLKRCCKRKYSKNNYVSLEIDRMLTLSTAHITPETGEFLNDPADPFLVVYKKIQFGWFMCLNQSMPHLPKDLADIINFAKNNECTCICLDRDGEEVSQLPIYNW